MDLLNSNDWLNILTALLVAWSCSMLGVFLMLRKMVMVGDAISHSVLPGIVLAYIIGSHTQSYGVLLGAAVFGVLTTILIEFFYRILRLQEDASIGLTFTWLFALGVLLIAFYGGGNADIDQECVLFGEIGLTFLDKWMFQDYLIGTRSFYMILPAFLLVCFMVIFGFKGLQLVSFQSDYAATKGISVGFWHYALMTLVSLVTVLSFESVGAILVVGFLIVPPATAYLISKSLVKVHLWSLGLATFSVLLGYWLGVKWNLSLSPMIISTAGFVFFLTLVVLKLRGRKKMKTQSVENKEFILSPKKFT